MLELARTADGIRPHELERGVVYSLGRDPETEEEVVRRYRLVVPWD